MNKFSIIIIDDNIDTDDIFNYTHVVNTDDLNFTSDIVEGIGVELCKKYPIHTTIIHEEYDRIWQISYVENIDEKKINNLTSSLTLDQKTICHNTVLFCSKVNNNGSCDNLSINMNDFTKLITTKINHIGCVINTQGHIDNFEFKHLTDIISNDYEYFSTTLFGFTLDFYVKKNNECKLLNKFASSVIKKKVYDNVYVVCKLGEYTYGNIDKILLQKIRQLYHTPIKLQDVTENEVKEERDSRGLLIVKNKWWMLKKKTNEFKNKFGICWICDKNTKLICTGCYRLHYCSKECQRNDWTNHKDECTRL